MDKAYSFFLIRLLGYAVILFSIKFMPDGVYTDIWFSLVLSHHILAFSYSKGRLVGLFGNSKKRVIFIFLFILGVSIGMFFDNIYTIILFFIHHTLTESYLASDYRFSKKGWLSKTSILSVSRILFEGSVMLAMCSADPELSFLSQKMLFLAVGISGLFYIFSYLSCRGQLGRAKKAEVLLPLASFLVLLFCYFSGFVESIRVIKHIFFYHVVIWVFIPWFQNGVRKKYSDRGIYIFATLALFSLIYYAVSPVVLPDDGSIILISKVLFVVGNVHILTTLALSKLNPRMLVRYFSSV